MAAKLTYNANWYTPSNIRQELTHGDAAAVRKEYTRLRDITQKRLRRMEQAGYTKTKVYRMNVKHYPVLKDIKTTDELAQRLADLSRFIESKRSTVSGLKKATSKALSTLHEHGYDFVTEKNIEEFGLFMEEFRANKLDLLYDSGDAYETFTLTQKHGLKAAQLKDNFEIWIEYKDQLEELRKTSKSYGDRAEMEKRLLNKRAKYMKSMGFD